MRDGAINMLGCYALELLTYVAGWPWSVALVLVICFVGFRIGQIVAVL